MKKNYILSIRQDQGINTDIIIKAQDDANAKRISDIFLKANKIDVGVSVLRMNKRLINRIIH